MQLGGGGTEGLERSLEVHLTDTGDLHLRCLTPRGLVLDLLHRKLFWKHDILTVGVH